MTVGPTLATALDDWLTDLAERPLSGRTITTYRSALRQFHQWAEAQPMTVELHTLQLSTFQAFIAALKARTLHQHTILDYIGVLTRWLQDLVNEGELGEGIPAGRGKRLQPAGVRERLERLVERRAPRVAPRIPDLRDLPNYYPQCLATFLVTRNEVPPPPAEAVPFRNYLTLLRNQALVGALFASGGRISEVLSLQTTQVRQHAIRHYVAQYMLEEGGLAYQDIAAIFGHASTVVTEQVYARLSEERVLELADTAAPRRRTPKRRT